MTFRSLILFIAFLSVLSTTFADESVKFKFEVQLGSGSSGTFVVGVHPDWAPIGAARFVELVDTQGFWKGIRFFRVISGFMAQFGIPGKPEVAKEWNQKKMVDDPVMKSNERGFLSYATSGEDSRTTQMFINLVDNSRLDGMGFAPFAEVLEGMDVVDKIYSGYGEGAPSGNGPDQGRIQAEGNRYLKQEFSRLSYIKSVTRLEEVAEDL
eukprot:CAMPEP_0195519244 /NCGR_PEP_ID=MMETSP0794_2-20130614/14537_1 /TAXON_ID=515487 /ORGANISM="Stephanopyxis turris, Strain CCMP 815" /LENGTH=209 /DNA_ID=CAMNT_0040648367 /DNA_START=70 /DNA_END=699 /DNA_ORIENTATION=+